MRLAGWSNMKTDTVVEFLNFIYLCTAHQSQSVVLMDLFPTMQCSNKTKVNFTATDIVQERHLESLEKIIFHLL